jgi:hypothetical protein
LILFGVGCSGQGGGYVPPEENARHALEAALTAWQHGEPMDKVQVDGANVSVTDSKWKAGARLISFEIVQTESPAEAADRPHVFLVRLKMEKPPAEKEYRYVIFGKNPLWVCDEDDYKRMSG